MEEVVSTLDAVPLEAGKPTAVIAHTVKSKGLSFAEGNLAYHYWSPDEEGLVKAEAEINQLIQNQEAEMMKGAGL
jgi:transketolase